MLKLFINLFVQREDARQLVKKQEELLRNLSKVRSEIEQEETQIGKAKDFYVGSKQRKSDYEHTLEAADKRRQQRIVDKVNAQNNKTHNNESDNNSNNNDIITKSLAMVMMIIINQLSR